MCKNIRLIFSTRSKYVFAADKPFHKLACWFTALDVLYRIKTDRKKESAVSVFDKIIKEDSVCFDIGAAYGRLTYDIARLAPKGKVYSFEPEAYSFKVMTFLMKLCGFKNVTTINNAVYNDKRTIELKIPLKENGKFAPHLSFGGSVNETDGSGVYHLETVDTIVLDEYAKENNIEAIDFIKCDIEGGELMVLKGAQGLIDKSRPVIFCEVIDNNLNHFDLTFADIDGYCKSINYKIYVEKSGKFETAEISNKNADYFFIPEEKVGSIIN